jgi:hypothetical protein
MRMEIGFNSYEVVKILKQHQKKLTIKQLCFDINVKLDGELAKVFVNFFQTAKQKGTSFDRLCICIHIWHPHVNHVVREAYQLDLFKEIKLERFQFHRGTTLEPPVQAKMLELLELLLVKKAQNLNKLALCNMNLLKEEVKVLRWELQDEDGSTTKTSLVKI